MSVINYCAVCKIKFVTNDKVIGKCPFCKKPMIIHKRNNKKKKIRTFPVHMAKRIK